MQNQKQKQEIELIADVSQTRLTRIKRIGHVLDSAVSIPGTSITLGLDSLLGLLPGVGDALGLVLSTSIVYMGVREGVRKRTTVRMLKNVLIDALVGTIPLLGDIFDVAWKANNKNVRLILEDLQRTSVERKARTNREIGYAALGVLALLLLLSAVAVLTLGMLLFKLIF